MKHSHSLCASIGTDLGAALRDACRANLRATLRTTLRAAAALLSLVAPAMSEAQTSFVPTVGDVPWVTLEALPAPELADKAAMSLFANEIRLTDAQRADTLLMCDYLADGNVVVSVGYDVPGAYSLSVDFDSLSLPAGGQLFVFAQGSAEAHEVVISKGGYAFSPTIDTDRLIVQYVGPKPAGEAFRVSRVFQGFRPIGQDPVLRGSLKAAGAYGSSDSSCEKAVACYNALHNERRSVCRLILNSRNLGTGVLVNNTAEDRRPLILTSGHVLGKDTMLRAVEARFCFEEPICDFAYHDAYAQKIMGGELVAYDETSDCALLCLDETPSPICRPYWSGWARSTAESGGVVCIHHPYGDAKKVSEGAAAVADDSYPGPSTFGNYFEDNVHWRVTRWNSGTTEGGSSGAPIFNGKGLVIGCLSGGRAACSNAKSDYFWMLARTWNRSSHGSRSISQVLDPLGLGVSEVRGIEGRAPDDSALLNGFSTFSGRDSARILHSALYATAAREEVAVAQPMVGPATDMAIWNVRLHAATVKCFDTSYLGSQVTLAIRKELDGQDLASVTKHLNVFSTDDVIDFTFPQRVVIPKGQAYFVVVYAHFVEKSERLGLAVTDNALAGEAKIRKAGELWQPLDSGCALMLSLATSVVSTQTHLPQEQSFRVWGYCESDVFAIVASGVADAADGIASVQIFDSNGRLVRQESPLFPARHEIRRCSMPSGLYVVRVVSGNGASHSFKIIFN